MALLPAHFLGSNAVDVAPSSTVKEFVAKSGGHTVITSVLIANNGIAAVKEIRSVRKWAYETLGNERAVQFTVMATPEDLKANADYIRMADQYVEVPGGSNNHNYANVELIVDVAERMGVHAVWAGWGHASENPKLPETLAKSRIVFIGPPGSAMRSLGDKISSTIVAQHAKVPCIPWSGSGIDQVHVDQDGLVTVPDEVYVKGCITSAEEGLEKAREIGFPVMIKASEGGGGKGIRKVDCEEKFMSLYDQVCNEVPGSPVFIMQLAGNARHLEVQLLADQYGNNISLFGRDCSVQRRHQKIIEEAPVTVARPETFAQMEKAAVRLGRLVGYVSAGTVEYLYSHVDDKFYFLELNPRLQVEHPTTEMVSGVNLPAAQLQIAMGLPLHRIRDIRLLYGVDPNSSTEIDFEFTSEHSTLTQRRPKPKGHTTACRITSEDPGEGFKPSSGTMHELNFRSSSNVWGYFSVSSAGGIHSFSDSQFGHIFAFGENRSASRKHMIVALKELSIRGDFRTTVEYLIKLLETPAFEDNMFTTGWLDELISNKLTAERPDAILAVVCGAVTKAHMASEECVAAFRTSMEKGQPPRKDILKTVFNIDFIYEGFRYKFTVTRSSKDSYYLFINGTKCSVGIRALADGGLLVLLNGMSHTCYFRDEVGATRLSIDSKTCSLEQENDPTELRTPSPGKLVKFLVENGERVRAGQAFAEVEVMKMYMPLVTSENGTVQLIKQPGATLEAGDILGILTLDDPTRVKHAKPFEGQLPEFGPPQVVGTKSSQRFGLLTGILKDILDGYDNQIVMESTVKELIDVLRLHELPYSQWSKEHSALHSRMPQALDLALSNAVDKAKSKDSEFPARILRKTIDRFFEEMKPNDASILKSQIEPLVNIIEDYSDGLKVHEYKTFIKLLEKYWEVETLFTGQNIRDDDVVMRLREENRNDISEILQIMYSHCRIGSKNNLVIKILEEYKPRGNESPMVIGKYFKPILRKLAELDHRGTAKVALKAREVLIQCALPSLDERTSQLQHILQASVIKPIYGEGDFEHRLPNLKVLKEVVDSKYVVFDVLPAFFAHKDPWLGLAALEVYVRRANRAYLLQEVNYHTEGDEPYLLSWKFKLTDASGYDKVIGAGSLQPSEPPTPIDNGSSVKRIASVSDMSYFISKNKPSQSRMGVVSPVLLLDDVSDALHRALDILPRVRSQTNGLTPDLNIRRRPLLKIEPPSELLNVCNILVKDAETTDDSFLYTRIKSIVDDFKDLLKEHGVRRITFVLGHKDGTYPKYFTFRGPSYDEDQSIRHIEPALAFQLELSRLSNFNVTPIFTDNRNIHTYEAIGKKVPSDKRYFIRAIVRPGRLRDDIPTAEYLISETDRLVNDILDGLEVINSKNSDLNHIFINFSPVFKLEPYEIENALGGFLDRFGRRLWRLRVTNAEIRMVCSDDAGFITPVRVLINNVSGFIVKVELYAEIKNSKGNWIFQSIGPPGSMHLREVSSAYPTKEWLQPKRYKAHLMGTTFAYDFPDLFRQAIRSAWQQNASSSNNMQVPDELLEYNELVIDENSELVEVNRPPGANNCGMVAWTLIAKTPEYPRGRRFILIANDITFKIGSFGPAEDTFFYKATQLARRLGIPRIYLSANSGARIGMADELIPLFSVAWNEPLHPESGFRYLYLTPEAKSRFKDGKEVITEKIVEDGEERHMITGIIGAEDGLGVECLRGSGLIAGATSRAYEDIFTITLVTCRSVGIGAYLVRLGQRSVQVEGQPIILTGAPAINKLLGHEVYASNLQLGGTQIMYKNGVSHLTANDDLEGVSKIVRWLAFVPEKLNAPVAISPSTDPWDRDIEYTPPQRASYDVRWLLNGKDGEEFLHGFFDRGSFEETLSGWAKTVVVGRARLAGIPIGVIAVETRTVENIVPADPANPDSTEQVFMEAGQVWYPNSAFKTAQAINDFNHGEQLPLIIFANWRGFSGGQRDMYNEVLKYGSYIVDALVKYKQPVFVYIPPFGELRGGSWVVVDSSINPDMMEMYADEEARAGVLEPEGIVEIKFKREKLLETMARLDPVYSKLVRDFKETDLDSEIRLALQVKLSERESLLMPIYRQISIQFADLHDRTGRMKAKETIRLALQWQDARRYFYWRVRRRLSEEQLLKSFGELKMSRHEQLSAIKSWYPGSKNYDSDDKEIALWLESSSKMIACHVEALKREKLTHEILECANTNKTEFCQAFKQFISKLSPAEKVEYMQMFN